MGRVKHIIIFLFAVFSGMPAKARSVAEIFKYAQSIERINPDSSSFYYQSIIEDKECAAYPEIAGKAYRKLALLQAGTKDASVVVELCNKAIACFQKINNKKETGITYNTIANIYQVRGYFDLSIAYYQKAAAFFDSIRFYKGLTICYSNIASIYNTTEQIRNALHYNLLAYQTANILKDTFSLGMIAHDVSVSYTKNGLVDSAAKFAGMALQLGKSIQDNFVTGYAWKAFFEYYKAEKDWDRAYSGAQHSLSFLLKTSSDYDIGFAYCNLAESALEMNRIADAKAAAENAERVSKKIVSFQLNKRVYGLLKDVAYADNDYKKAFEYAQLYQQFSDSVFFEKRNNALNELETRYQTAQKETKIAQQQVDIQQQEVKTKQAKIRFLIAFISFIVLLIGAAFLYFFLKQRQKLLQNRIITIEQQKKLELTKAIIDGEEQERTRLAKELHDGIGGLMSMIKLRFNSFRDKHSYLTDEKEFSETLQLVDVAAQDIRKISHALMPSALERLGLIDAAEQFCQQINAAGKTEIDLQYYGFKERLDTKIELLAYRIIQELINNILKHADATEVILQLTQHEQLITITIEDNGKGFDVKTITQKDGIGLHSMKNRIELLGGRMDIDSGINKGTSIHIELPLK